jgi:nucleoside-diphosphate-sugar epimerase
MAKTNISLVTGATSMLGRKVAERLIEEGGTVRVILKNDPKASNEWRMLPAGVVPYVSNIALSDHKNQDALVQACKGVTNIFHIAGATYSAKNTYDQLLDINVIGTENVIKAWLEANPEPAKGRIIFTSTVSVYGHSRPGELLNERSEIRAEGPYAMSKYMATHVIESWCSANPRLSYTIARLGAFYGEGYESRFFKIFRLVSEGKMSYLRKGSNHLALIHIDDAVEAMMRIYANGDKSSNKTYNLTDGIAHTQKELLDMAAKFLNAKPITGSPYPLLSKLFAGRTDIRFDEHDFLNSDRVVSIDLARKELGFKPSKSLEKESKTLAEHYLSMHVKTAENKD